MTFFLNDHSHGNMNIAETWSNAFTNVKSIYALYALAPLAASAENYENREIRIAKVFCEESA